MIGIDMVQAKDYTFPTVDFKFQNTGSATALLWQFAVCISRAEIDPTPAFDSNVDVQDNRVQVELKNLGWGAARNLQVQIDEPILNQIFPLPVRRYQGAIESGGATTVFRLTTDLANLTQLKSIERKFTTLTVEENSWHSFGISRGASKGLVLKSPQLTWSCEDEKGQPRQGQEKLSYY